jgi:hypothetical protein
MSHVISFDQKKRELRARLVVPDAPDVPTTADAARLFLRGRAALRKLLRNTPAAAEIVLRVLDEQIAPAAPFADLAQSLASVESKLQEIVLDSPAYAVEVLIILDEWLPPTYKFRGAR